MEHSGTLQYIHRAGLSRDALDNRVDNFGPTLYGGCKSLIYKLIYYVD